MPLRMEKPVKSPIVPPIRPNWPTRVTFDSRLSDWYCKHFINGDEPLRPFPLYQMSKCQSRCGSSGALHSFWPLRYQGEFGNQEILRTLLTEVVWWSCNMTVVKILPPVVFVSLIFPGHHQQFLTVCSFFFCVIPRIMISCHKGEEAYFLVTSA